jgi:hypothetical protein
MQADGRERLRQIWGQGRIPVLARTRHAGLRARLPFRSNNRAWLKGERRSKPKWDQQGQYWTVPKAWFNDLVEQCLATFGRVYIIQPHRAQEKCAPACWNAVGDVCQCSCMGEHHGSQSPAGRWKVVSDTFASRWGDEETACRLVTRKV